LAKWIVTSAWPYSYDVPHLGNLIGSVLSADMMARYLRLKGHDVLMVSGSDEHGTPVELEALKRGIPVRQFADANHQRISELFKRWNLSYDNYTRTENPVHIQFTREHYLQIERAGYISTQEELVHYCPRDNRFLPDRFVEGICPVCGVDAARGDQCDNCGKPIESSTLIKSRCAVCGGPTQLIPRKQWFFDLPKLTEEIRDFIKQSRSFSQNTVNFCLSWIKEGLKPRSLTRDTSWGIPAPFEGAEGRTIYVWMEAVLGYLSAVKEYFIKRGEEERWKEYWLDKDVKTCYFIGKDNIPFHAIIFTALLLASRQGYTLPYAISSTEFLQFEGKKFSKSKKVGIWIDEALEILDADYWRYTLLSIRPESGDVNFTYDLLVEKVNSDLNDSIGNFVNRTLTAVQRFSSGRLSKPTEDYPEELAVAKSVEERHRRISELYEAFELQKAVKLTLQQAEEGNKHLNAMEPWKKFKSEPARALASIYTCCRILKVLCTSLFPIIPQTAMTLHTFLGLKPEGQVQPWDEATEDFKGDVVIGKFHPLFRKISKEEIITKLQEIRRRGE